MSGYIGDFALRTALKNVKLEDSASRSGASIVRLAWSVSRSVSWYRRSLHLRNVGLGHTPLMTGHTRLGSQGSHF